MDSQLIAFALICAALLSGCEKQAEVSAKAGDVTVERLFTYDGCTAYRFEDGRTVHFVRCDTRTETSWRYSCGKNCVRTDSVTTENAP
jgi:hypothetical protein